MLCPDPAKGANGVPRNSWLDFGERKGGGKGGKERAMWGRRE